jgi:hypothetical protein
MAIGSGFREGDVKFWPMARPSKGQSDRNGETARRNLPMLRAPIRHGSAAQGKPMVFARLVGTSLLGAAAALLPMTAAFGQQASPAVPSSAPLMGLDGKTPLGALASAPVPDAKGGAGPNDQEMGKSIDPPRTPVDPHSPR